MSGVKNEKNRSSLLSFYKYVTPSGGFAWEDGLPSRTSNSQDNLIELTRLTELIGLFKAPKPADLNLRKNFQSSI